MWDGEGGAGSGLESLGWPHTRPSREPLDRAMLVGLFGQQRPATEGLALREEDWGHSCSLCSLRQVCLWGWECTPIPPQRSCAPGL